MAVAVPLDFPLEIPYGSCLESSAKTRYRGPDGALNVQCPTGNVQFPGIGRRRRLRRYALTGAAMGGTNAFAGWEFPVGHWIFRSVWPAVATGFLFLQKILHVTPVRGVGRAIQFSIRPRAATHWARILVAQSRKTQRDPKTRGTNARTMRKQL